MSTPSPPSRMSGPVAVAVRVSASVPPLSVDAEDAGAPGERTAAEDSTSAPASPLTTTPELPAVPLAAMAPTVSGLSPPSPPFMVKVATGDAVTLTVSLPPPVLITMVAGAATLQSMAPAAVGSLVGVQTGAGT
ncbi:MAG TPA: hypothetical protein VNB64_08600 [Solirubrobacteraceae bacterium]|nr:hypothetical protein [Solirubrobacteraceae bacterium]